MICSKLLEKRNFVLMKKQLSFFSEFKLGLSSYLRALSFIFEKGLWVYSIYAIVIAIGLFFAELAFAESFIQSLETQVFELLPFAEAGSSFGKILYFFVRIGLYIVFYFIFLTLNKYLLLILLSPLMAVLSEKTEAILTGKEYPFEFLQFVKDVLRGIALALRNMCLEFGFILLSLFVIWIPVLGWLCPIFLFVLSCYFYGFSMIDYTNERRKLTISQSIVYVKQHKGLAVGNGFVFCLLFALPYIGVIFAAMLGPVSASIALLEAERNE